MNSLSVRVLACLIVVLGGCASHEDPEPPLSSQPAALVPPSFVDAEVARGLDSPTTMAFAPDGRLFVSEQSGELRVIEGGVLRPEPFLTVDTDDSGERGLLGVTFDPDFPAAPYVYVYYTARSPTVHNRVSRFTASGDRAVPGSEVVLLELDPLSSSIHNGGALHFGTDGKLYVAVGDNGRGVNAQTLSNLFGKVLRLNKDGSIPTDNPFFSEATGSRRAIWALGLRNPFSFAIQPGTGRLLINDVGAGDWEEVNEGVSGANYGWPTTEGPTSDPRFRGPRHAYRHGSGNDRGCAITGGVFYSPPTPRFPAQYEGKYFFADYCGGWIRTLDPSTGATAPFASGLDAPVDLDVGSDGNLYYLDRGAGAVHRISYTLAGEPPVLALHPASQRVSTGGAVTFTVSAAGGPGLRYQWLRNGVELPGATSASLTLPSVAAGDSGARFQVRVSNDFGSVLSREAVLTVENNTPPVAVITLPAAEALYRAGETVTFSGLGTDAEDGTLPPSAFTWRVDFHHDDHVHPFLPPTRGVTGGTFTLPDTASETAATVWYRIHLEVTDSRGAKHAVYRDVLPRTSRLRIATEPLGLTVTLDGQPRIAPAEVLSVVGMVRTLGVVPRQVVDGRTYVFERWSDGSTAETRDVRTAEADTLYRALFRLVGEEPPPGPGTGLRAEYFGTPELTELRLTRVDPTVDFRWKGGTPAAEVSADHFSVRWTGSVVPRYSETYTFRTDTNDGVRLWVNGQLLIDDWRTHGSSVTHTATLTLEAGRAYSIRMEFFELKGWATARLLWSSPSQRREVIPESQLRPTAPTAR